MNTLPIIITVVVALVLIGLLLGMSFARRKRTERLHDQYGPEYDRTVKTLGDEKKAQAELIERQKHVEALDIRSLSGAVPTRAISG